MKTSDLTGPALDWAVDEARGFGADYLKWWRVGGDTRFTHCEIMRAYSTDWSQGGSIIERENLSVMPAAGEGWRSYKTHRVDWAQQCYADGPTPLVAAMRCYVASRLGDTIDIPEELQ